MSKYYLYKCEECKEEWIWEEKLIKSKCPFCKSDRIINITNEEDINDPT
jgi:hypothetical protein